MVSKCVYTYTHKVGRILLTETAFVGRASTLERSRRTATPANIYLKDGCRKIDFMARKYDLLDKMGRNFRNILVWSTKRIVQMHKPTPGGYFVKLIRSCLKVGSGTFYDLENYSHVKFSGIMMYIATETYQRKRVV
jgi:hypothetical protein